MSFKWEKKAALSNKDSRKRGKKSTDDTMCSKIKRIVSGLDVGWVAVWCFHKSQSM